MAHVTVVLGGPGAGKTRRLIRVLAEELEQVAPERIAYLSYTRQGTYQGVELAKERFDLEPEQCLYMRTLHAILFRHYELKKDDIIGRKDLEFLQKHLGVERLDDYLTFLDMQRNNAKVAAKMYDELALESYTVRYVEENYKEYKKYFKKYDFTDLIERVIVDKLELSVDVAIIDEAQDLTTLQWMACQMLFRNVKRLYLAGDPNQSIYDWAGADYKYFMRIQADTVEVLPKTYRLPRAIWELGKQVHAMIDVSTPYPQECKEEEGVLVEVGSHENVPIKKDKTHLFLARTNQQLVVVEEYLKARGLQYTTSEGKPAMSKKKTLFIAAYADYMYKGRSNPKQKKALNAFLTDDELAAIKAEGEEGWHGAFANALKWYDAEYALSLLVNKGWRTDPNAIRVATMHKVKGAEANIVAVLTDASRKTMKRFYDDPDAELRVLFVALTRASEELYIVRSNSKYSYPIVAIKQGVAV